MNADALRAWPERPPSEVEWEDLLYRLELMVRALRVTLEDAPAEDAGLERLLRAAIAEEARVHAWLRERTGSGALDGAALRRLVDEQTRRGATAWLAERFASLRLRNFAMLQRRGLGVWDWQGELPGGPHATAYQLLGARMRDDGALLSALRERLRAEAAPC